MARHIGISNNMERHFTELGADQWIQSFDAALDTVLSERACLDTGDLSAHDVKYPVPSTVPSEDDTSDVTTVQTSASCTAVEQPMYGAVPLTYVSSADTDHFLFHAAVSAAIVNGADASAAKSIGCAIRDSLLRLPRWIPRPVQPCEGEHTGCDDLEFTYDSSWNGQAHTSDMNACVQGVSSAEDDADTAAVKAQLNAVVVEESLLMVAASSLCLGCAHSPQFLDIGDACPSQHDRNDSFNQTMEADRKASMGEVGQEGGMPILGSPLDLVPRPPLTGADAPSKQSAWADVQGIDSASNNFVAEGSADEENGFASEGNADGMKEKSDDEKDGMKEPFNGDEAGPKDKPAARKLRKKRGKRGKAIDPIEAALWEDALAEAHKHVPKVQGLADELILLDFPWRAQRLKALPDMDQIGVARVWGMIPPSIGGVKPPQGYYS